jgi:pimeloyl-ACP methyl ester carboxylesterase
MRNGATDPQRPQATVRVNGVELGVETFSRDDDPLVLLAGGTTMLSWPDSLCERLAVGGRRVVRYDLRDCGASTTLDPEVPAYNLRDLATDAAALVDTLDGAPAHLGGIGVSGMVAQVTALDHPHAFSALTLLSTRPVAPGPVDDDLPDHDVAIMDAMFSRPMPDWTDRAAVAAYAADGAALLGNDSEHARAVAARIWDRTHPQASPRCSRQISSEQCSPTSTARHDGASASPSSRCQRSSCTGAGTRSSQSGTARRSPPLSPPPGCSSSTTWAPPCRRPWPTRLPPRCSLADSPLRRGLPPMDLHGQYVDQFRMGRSAPRDDNETTSWPSQLAVWPLMELA